MQVLVPALHSHAPLGQWSHQPCLPHHGVLRGDTRRPGQGEAPPSSSCVHHITENPHMKTCDELRKTPMHVKASTAPRHLTSCHVVFTAEASSRSSHTLTNTWKEKQDETSRARRRQTGRRTSAVSLSAPVHSSPHHNGLRVGPLFRVDVRCRLCNNSCITFLSFTGFLVLRFFSCLPAAEVSRPSTECPFLPMRRVLSRVSKPQH